jgi:hypothetical protein
MDIRGRNKMEKLTQIATQKLQKLAADLTVRASQDRGDVPGWVLVTTAFVTMPSGMSAKRQ